MNQALAHIVDDDEAMRDALNWLLRSRQVPTATWPDAEAFLTAWEENFCGCLILDIRMPGMSGLELFDQLQAHGCSLPIIFLTGHGDVPQAVAALKKGAYDFIEKPFDDNNLVDRVIAALAQDAGRRDRQALDADIATRLAQLSPREREVMEYILAGKYNKVTADELHIAMRTVEVHRSRIFEKMGVRTAVDLARLLTGRSRD
ncbi:MAG: response regulator transcription factor [Betaproteobacteria bacterium]|nr:response regulator transcription factor [Betaproteobacteria bacterium]